MSALNIRLPPLVFTPSTGSPNPTVAVPTVTDPTGRVKFCRFEIPIWPRPLLDAMNQPVASYPLQIGGTILHWADPVRAFGWFRYAGQLLKDQAKLSALDTPVNTSDKDLNHKQANDQLSYVGQILTAIARGYNLLNIIWWNDPDARRLYRQYVSGPPKLMGASAASIYAEQDDFNPQWYTKIDILPKARTGASILQTAAIRSVGGHADIEVPFVVSAMPLALAMGPLKSTQTPEFADFIYNGPMVRMKYAEICVTPNEKPLSSFMFPWVDQCNMDGLSPNNGFNILKGDLNAFMPDGSKLPDGFDDWRAKYWGDMTGAGSGATAPLRDYLAWFSAWVSAVLARDAFEIIQDSRAWVAYTNSSTLQFNGGQQAAIQQIIGTPTDVTRQQHTLDPGWVAVAASIAAATTATGNPIVAVVGGAVSAIITVANALVIHDVHGHGRDDLGRYKLAFERAWLSGAPESLDAGLGSPTLPPEELVDPPGVGTLWIPPTGSDGCAPPPTALPPGTPGAQGTAGTPGAQGAFPLWLFMLVAAATAGYFVWQSDSDEKEKRKGA